MFFAPAVVRTRSLRLVCSAPVAKAERPMRRPDGDEIKIPPNCLQLPRRHPVSGIVVAAPMLVDLALEAFAIILGG